MNTKDKHYDLVLIKVDMTGQLVWAQSYKKVLFWHFCKIPTMHGYFTKWIPSWRILDHEGA